jgi:orotidine-5'-phosphate decarboxylase
VLRGGEVVSDPARLRAGDARANPATARGPDKRGMARSRPKLIVALDFPTVREAAAAAETLAGVADMFKVGLELFNAEGPAALRAIGDIGGPVFYDSKLLDIPNTVAGAAAGLTMARVAMFNVHAAGGAEMMQAAAGAAARTAEGLGISRPLVLGVTVLTSIDEDTLRQIGVARSVRDQVVALARMARDAGLDGVIASPHEIRDVKETCGEDFLVVTPGIRPAGSERGDQKRVMTPGEAAQAGADYIVVGRPITRAGNPGEAAARIVQELAAA